MRKIQLYLNDIIESIEKIEKYCEDVDEEKFLADYEKQDAVIRRLEIIGEAVKKLPKQIKNKYPEVQWKSIAGMRNILTHEYFGVDIKKVWLVTQKEIKELKKVTIEIINSSGNNFQLPFN